MIAVSDEGIGYAQIDDLVMPVVCKQHLVHRRARTALQYVFLDRDNDVMHICHSQYHVGIQRLDEAHVDHRRSNDIIAVLVFQHAPIFIDASQINDQGRSRRSAKPLSSVAWAIKYPRGWVLPLKGQISAFMKWLINDATFGLFTLRS